MKSDKELKTELQTVKFELLVPANNKDIAIKAINAGADAVYIGYSKYGARFHAGNSIEDIAELIEYAHIFNVKVYITLNTILKDEELKDIEKLIHKLYKINADGIIIQDMGILECDIPPIPVIASTQCHNNTIDKIKFLEKTGFKRVILPRESTLKEIQDIRKNTNIELECFIHGALCTSYSGQCYLSYAIGGRSANRGECAQPCRRKYSLKDAEGKIIAENKYLLSLKDLNMSEHLESLILSGVTSFKIEGRLKNEAYVINTTAYYRNIIDKILENYSLKRSSTGTSKLGFEPDLYKTFNRGYTDFLITGEKNNIATVNYTSSLGEYIGVVEAVKKNYFSLKSNVLNNGDGICFFNDNKELIGTNINKIENDLIYPADIKGIKPGVKIYRNFNKNFDDKLTSENIQRKIHAKIRVRETSAGYLFILTDIEDNSACYLISANKEPAINKEKALNTLKIQLCKSGNSDFYVEEADIKLKNIPFLKVSKINEIRRTLTDKLKRIRKKNYKLQRRNDNFNVTEYPIQKLNYKSNIMNEKAALFYKRRGCFIEEMAVEKTKDTKNKKLMTSKYCIKKQLGLCTKQVNIKKYAEPFVLTDEFNKKYLVEFNCKDCIMELRIV